MRTSILAVGFVLGSALAAPHNHPKNDHHDEHHGKGGKGHPSLIPTGTGSLGPIGTGIANSTLHTPPGASGNHALEDTMEGLNVPKNGAGSTDNVDTTGNSALAIQDKHADAADDCSAATVTVTTGATVTVTAGAGSAQTGVTDASTNKSPKPAGPAESNDAPAKQPSSGSTSNTRSTSGNTQQSAASNEEEEDSTTPSSSAAPVKSSTPATTGSTTGGTTGGSSGSGSSSSGSSSGSTDSTVPTSDDSANTTTTPSANTNAAPAAGQPFKTKRGIIASGSSSESLAAAFANTKLSWLGNWYSGPPHSLPASLTFVPQNYGKQSDVKGEWTKNAQQAVDKGAKYFLSFGEPGTPNDKLHMEPAEAVELWRKVMEPYAKQGVTIGAPGTLQNTQDFEWLNKFIDACTGCSIGFIALHWFDKAGAKQVPGFKETVGKAKVIADKIGKPVWLDNFSAEGDEASQKEFLGEVVPWLEQQPYVAAYAYVPPEVGKAGSGANMVGADGKLNALGQYYANL